MTDMPIDSSKFNWNVNTIIGAATLVVALSTIAGSGYVWANTTRDIEEVKQWEIAHDALHRERQADVSAQSATFVAEMRGVGSDVLSLQRKADATDYRMTVVEQGFVATKKDVEDLKENVSDMKGDLKVILEIVKRLDKKN